MSILSGSTETRSKAEILAARTRQVAKSNYEQLCRMQKDGIRMIWANAQGLTPQEACDAIGTECAKVFQLHGFLTEAIVKIASTAGVAPDISLPTFAFTANEDGTVTISDKPYGQ